MAQPSYSDYEFGYSNNATLGGSTWGMSSSLFPVPTVEGVDINGVFYQYTAIKQQDDPYIVSIQNQNANGSGYIFRETDDWTRGSGGTITKFVPLPYSPLGDWGTGEIEQVGIGSVQDPTVLYSFRFDPDAVSPPELPILPDIPTYDPLADRYVMDSLEPTDLTLIEDDEPEQKEDEDEDKDRLETALAASDNALTIASGMSQSALVQAMNIATNMNAYYDRQIAGGTYKEVIVLQDKNIPDNRRAFRSLAQDRVHKQLIDSQY